MASRKKELLKVILLGDGGVGKTALLNRFVGRSFSSDYKATIGADFVKKNIVVNGNVIVLDVWDTAGQERFRSLGVAFYRGADCCLLVYDVTDPHSFSSLDEWRDEFLLHSSLRDPESFPFVVIGNKVDAPQDTWKVSTAELDSWLARNSHIPSFQTSALNNTNVDLAFHEAARLALARDHADQSGVGGELPEDIQLNPTPATSSNCWC